jgi:hypothetical protein
VRRTEEPLMTIINDDEMFIHISSTNVKREDGHKYRLPRGFGLKLQWPKL